MADQFHWLPLCTHPLQSSHCRSQISTGSCSKVSVTKFSVPSATSLCPLRSSDRLDLFVPRVATTMAQCRSFACIGPSLWNGLPPSLHSTILSGSISTSFYHLKTFLFSWSTLHWEHL